jgi:hypothetical protein
MMSELLLFQLSVASGLIAWIAVSRAYIWPAIKEKSLVEGAKPLLYLNLFRYVGLMFMIPGVVSKDLSPDFGASAGWGDLITAGLAGVTLLLSRTQFFRLSLWVFNIVGLVDLLHAFYEARVILGINPSDFEVAFYIPTIYVPLLLCSHVMIFLMLVAASKKSET